MNTDIHMVEKETFPPLLHEIPEPPKQLYIRGSLPPKGYTYLTIVGSRHYSTYGKQVIDELISGLSGYPISIVSGLALGIDCLAHEAALRYGLHTVSVPGSGLDDRVIYPRRHAPLARKILTSGGALLSEYEPMQTASDWTFPQRNRIMAGMSPATLIIEATQKSGTLITARLATDYNRDVLTVPGSIFSHNTEGPHMLLKLGAVPITTSTDILDALHIESTDTPVIERTLSQEEESVLSFLSEPRERDELLTLLRMDIHEANALLSLMELNGYITESHGTITAMKKMHTKTDNKPQ